MGQRTYLFPLAHPSAESARLAVTQAREHNLRVLAQHGTQAIEVLAGPDAAGRLFATGLFSAHVAGAISKEHVQAADDAALQPLLRQWNARFSPAYRRAKRDRTHLGRSWVAPGYEPPGLYSRFDPVDILPLWEERAKEHGLEEPPKTKERQRAVRGKAYLAAREYFRDAVADEILRVDVADLYVRSPKTARHRFYDKRWLEILIELLHDWLHESAGDEPECRTMHGRVSVGVVFVNSARRDGPRFTTSTRDTIMNEIQSGLSWLVGEHPSGNLVWVYDRQDVEVDVDDQANGDDSDTAFDEYWRFPAMEQIDFAGHTYAGSNAGTDAYRDDMRAHHRTDYATVIFVTKFGTSWHAYSTGRRFILLSEHGNDWGGWGQSDLNHIAAHEMCHQFGARDEYGGEGTPCDSCSDKSGCDAIPNGNCEGCAQPAQGCVMRVHEPSMCAYTRGQIGWADIFVELWTDDDWLSGTDDDVELDIGLRTFTLDTPDHDDRETGNREGYAVWAGGALTRDEIRRLLIRKSDDGAFGGWKLHRVRVFHDGEELCDESPDRWLEDRRRWWVAKEFDGSVVHRVRLEVRTGDVQWAGTDDDVTLKLAGRSWDVDSDANDFERGSNRWYELDPRTGIRISDVASITIRKSPDGLAGGWRLGGLRLELNGTRVYDNTSINRWLEDDDRVFSDGIT